MRRVNKWFMVLAVQCNENRREREIKEEEKGKRHERGTSQEPRAQFQQHRRGEKSAKWRRRG